MTAPGRYFPQKSVTPNRQPLPDRKCSMTAFCRRDPGASAQVDQEAAKRASLTGLEKHLAVPFDLQSAQIKRVSANTE